MTTLVDQSLRDEAVREARGSSGLTLRTAGALSLILLTQQAHPDLVAALNKHLFAGETKGTGTAIVSLRITEQDVLAQLARVYRELSREQVDLDAETRRILYANLWSLY
jgi:hypothetical protein